MFVFSGTDILHFLRFPVTRNIFNSVRRNSKPEKTYIQYKTYFPLHKYFTTDRFIETFKV